MNAPRKVNGHGVGGPLNLTPAERHALLAQHGMAEGWLLLTRAEFLALKQTMGSCQQENDRLNKELAAMIAAKVVRDEGTETK